MVAVAPIAHCKAWKKWKPKDWACAEPERLLALDDKLLPLAVPVAAVILSKPTPAPTFPPAPALPETLTSETKTSSAKPTTQEQRFAAIVFSIVQFAVAFVQDAVGSIVIEEKLIRL